MTTTPVTTPGRPGAWATRRLALAAALAVAGLPAAAAAQPADAAPPPDAARPVPPPDADAAARAAYDAAFADLLAGRLDAAAAGFDQAALGASDPALRGAASELARLARDLIARRVRLVADAPSPGVEPDVTGRAGSAGSADTRADLEDATEGRTGFVISTTLASIYGGVVLIDLTDTDDFRPGVAMVLGTTTVGFLGSYFGSRDRRITSAMADAYSVGLGLGVGNGLLLASPLGVESRDGLQGLALGSMVLGGGAGLLAASRTNPTRGQVSLASLASVLGIATTGLGLAIIQPEIEDGDNILLLLTAGLDAGAIAGIGLGRGIDWSVSRARLIGLGTGLGALAGFGLTALATGVEEDDDTARLWASGTLVGMWGGFALTTYLTRDMTPDRRFARPDGVVLAPAAIPGGAGLSVAGTF